MQIEIGSKEIVDVLQESFPMQYTICVQRVHILKLEAMLSPEAPDLKLVPTDPDPVEPAL